MVKTCHFYTMTAGQLFSRTLLLQQKNRGVFDDLTMRRSKEALPALDAVVEQLHQSHRSIAELCYEHREWQRSIEMMLNAIEENTTKPIPTLPTLLQDQDAQQMQQMDQGEQLQNQEGREERSTFNSTVTPIASTPGTTGVTHIPSSTPAGRPRSTKTSVPFSSASSERYRPARHFYKSPRSFRGSLLQSRNCGNCFWIC